MQPASNCWNMTSQSCKQVFTLHIFILIKLIDYHQEEHNTVDNNLECCQRCLLIITDWNRDNDGLNMHCIEAKESCLLFEITKENTVTSQ